jgi:hypothetical protein
MNENPRPGDRAPLPPVTPDAIRAARTGTAAAPERQPIMPPFLPGQPPARWRVPFPAPRPHAAPAAAPEDRAPAADDAMPWELGTAEAPQPAPAEASPATPAFPEPDNLVVSEQPQDSGDATLLLVEAQDYDAAPVLAQPQDSRDATPALVEPQDSGDTTPPFVEPQALAPVEEEPWPWEVPWAPAAAEAAAMPDFLSPQPLPQAPLEPEREPEPAAEPARLEAGPDAGTAPAAQEDPSTGGPLEAETFEPWDPSQLWDDDSPAAAARLDTGAGAGASLPPTDAAAASMAERVAARLETLAGEVRGSGLAALGATDDADELSRLLAGVIAGFIARENRRE